jgi:uncharacterized protein
MASPNVEIVRRCNEVFNNGDLDRLMERFAPDAEMRDRGNAPDQPSVLRGREAIRETIEQWTTEFDQFRCDVDAYFEAGEAVICSAHWHGRGKASGIWIDVRQWDVWELVDGKVVRATLGCRTKEEALEAVADNP